MEFEIHEFFAIPPEGVFDALTDLDGLDKWMPGFVRMERVAGEGFGPGTEWRETRKFFGKEATEQFEVTGADRPKRIEIRVDGAKGTSKKGEYLFTYRLEPDQGGTRVYLSGEIRGVPALFRMIGFVLIIPYKKACANDLKALKTHLEAT